MGGRSGPEEEGVVFEPLHPDRPGWAAVVALGVGLCLLLLANGRPIGAGDTRATEHVASRLVQNGTLDLDPYPEVEPPFSRKVGSHRVSIYPVLSAVLAAPVFAAARLAFALDETGSALAGKTAACLLSGLGAALLFLAVGERRGGEVGAWTAAIFALGTSVWSTSQALWQHPAAVLFLCAALASVGRAARDDRWAGRAGLPLALAVAARHADVALVAALGLGIVLRWPRRILGLVLWASPAVALELLYQSAYFGSPLSHGFSESLARFSEPWGVGQAGLLLSPGKGLFVFTPVCVVAVWGLVRAFRQGERWLAATLGAGVLAHVILLGRWSEWHGGECFGPRMMTDALPLLFLFLPEGMDAFGGFGRVLAVLSVLVQALGAFSYDYRWERLYQRPAASPGHPELWNPATSPLLFYAERRLVILALPAVEEYRAFVREYPVVLFGPHGSRVTFSEDDLVVRGAEPTLGDVHLVHGARVQGGRLRLQGHWDGLFLRVLPEARLRRLELRIVGRGQGTLYVGERTFWTLKPRWVPYPVAGAFRIRHPYSFAESGGADVVVTVGKNGGDASLELVALVSPGDADQPIQAP